MGDPRGTCRTEDRLKRVTHDEVNGRAVGRGTGAREKMDSPRNPF